MKNVNIFVRCRQHERKFSLPFFCFRYILLLEIGETAKAKARFFTEKCLIFQHKGLPSRVVTGGAYEQQTHPARHRRGDRCFDRERLHDPQRGVRRVQPDAARLPSGDQREPQARAAAARGRAEHEEGRAAPFLRATAHRRPAAPANRSRSFPRRSRIPITR